MSHARATAERCPGCGLVVPGSERKCRAVFEQLIARDLSDALNFSVHRMTVDTYSLQHPERYCASAKSLAAHLCGLLQILEEGASAATADRSLQRWLSGRVDLAKPDPPAFRGGLTVADVVDAPDAAAHATAVERWARTTWEAYAPLQALAREWLARARSR